MLKLKKTIASILNRIIIFVPGPAFVYKKFPAGYYRVIITNPGKNNLIPAYVKR